MRLQLIAVLLALASPAGAQVDDRDPGDGSVEGAVALYADDDATTVWTTMVTGDVRLPAVAVSAHALVDAVSSASVDVVSAATPRWTEDRVELGARAATRVHGVAAGLAYTTSGENDWRSHTIVVDLARDLARKNTTVGLSYGFTSNRIGRAHDPTFERSLTVHAAELTLTQVLGRQTLATAAATIERADGYQGSPYRYVTTADGVTAAESPPADRTRAALTLRLLRTVGEAATLDASYRVYVDGWGLRSHTGQLAWTRELTDAVELRLRARVYYQGAADFYRETYEMPARFMTADRELSRFWDAGSGLRLGYHGDAFNVDARADGTYYRFPEFARLAGRVALVTGGDVTWRW